MAVGFISSSAMGKYKARRAALEGRA